MYVTGLHNSFLIRTASLVLKNCLTCHTIEVILRFLFTLWSSTTSLSSDPYRCRRFCGSPSSFLLISSAFAWMTGCKGAHRAGLAVLCRLRPLPLLRESQGCHQSFRRFGRYAVVNFCLRVVGGHSNFHPTSFPLFMLFCSLVSVQFCFCDASHCSR